MDPLSLTASLLAILGASGAIAKGLNKIRRLKDAPGILLQLNNEVTDLHLLIRGVDELYTQQSDSTNISLRDIVYSTLVRAKEALLELEQLISYQWTKETDNGVEVDRSVWIRAQTKIKETKDRIRNVRNDLNGAWAVISSRGESRRIELQLQQVLISIGDLRQGHSENQGLLDQTIGYLSNQGQSLEVLQQRTQQYFTNTPSTGTSGNNSENTYFITSPSRANDAPSSDLPPLSGSSSSTLHLRVARRYKCQITCTCSCHRISLYKSPYRLKTVLGCLFIGYAGLPIFSRPCSTTSCQANNGISFQSCYVFPSWLLNWAVCLMVVFTKTLGPELILRCLRVQPRSSIFFQSLLQRGSDHTMTLIAAGSGSVLDVDEQSCPAVYHLLSVILRRYLKSSPMSDRLVLLSKLIGEGADLFLENDFKETPYTIAWRCHLMTSARGAGSEMIDRIIHTADPLEVLGFNELHASVAGPKASNSNFASQLQLTTRQDIDSRDNTRRTVLSWAVELGSSEVIDKLLTKGADPDLADNRGYTPLFYCVPKAEVLRSLLHAGANVNHISRDGRTSLYELLRVSDNIDVLETLWTYGADLDHRERSFGWTPLHVAISYNRVQSIRWLLQKNVDIDVQDNKGMTPLMYAVWGTIYFIIEWLLDKSANCQLIDIHGESLLHYLARFGSIEAVLVLQQAGLSGLDIQQNSNKGYYRYKPCPDPQTALNIAQQRRDKNAEWALENLEPRDSDPQAWFSAFQALIDSIQASDVAEHCGDFWRGLDNANTIQPITETVESDQDDLPRLPGAYIDD